ncbi:RING-H2 finger protein ATL51-like [Lycium barbarum]|uniref:RING-H2 finger protein ATL51-like n=1 Tax=Lycium barbarum TaxID=112863 RepID=UPI00293EC146|nr:RING-H2 finger protein ATL51-like [Lycium barbarum]
MGEDRGLEITPALVGVLGVIAGAIIVVIIGFVIVTWCKNNTSPDPPEQSTTIPVTQSQNPSRANAQREISSSTSTSTSNSMVQLIVVSSYNKNSKEDMCSICLGEFMEGDEVRVLSQCLHIFHVSCIDVWLHSHRNCPLCRADTTTIPPQRRLTLLLPES